MDVDNKCWIKASEDPGLNDFGCSGPDDLETFLARRLGKGPNLITSNHKKQKQNVILFFIQNRKLKHC